MNTRFDDVDPEGQDDPNGGSENRSPEMVCRDRWIEELLAAAGPLHRQDANHELRIQKILAALEDATPKRTQLPQHIAEPSPFSPLPTVLLPKRRWAKWVTLTLAGSIVVMLFFVFQQNQTMRQALAVVEKSLQAADESVPRHYAVTSTFLDRDRTTLRSVACDLYVCGNRQYALRHPALVGSGDLWIGRNGDSTWVVPARGPVRVGDETALHRWLEGNQELATPYLHLTSLLQRLSRGYRLQERSENAKDFDLHSVVAINDMSSSLSDAQLRQCRRISGERINQQATQNPEQIELWCDRETGVALRVVAIWDPQTNPRGRRSLVVDLVSSVELSEDWFDHAGHYPGRRLILNFD